MNGKISRHVGVVFVLGALALGAMGCGDEAKTAPASLEAAMDKWKATGLTLSDFTEADAAALGAAACKTGTVAGVDVTICECADDAAAKAAQGKGLEWVGENTGTALTSGKLLLVVRDPRKADPSGKSINKIVNEFRGK